MKDFPSSGKTKLEPEFSHESGEGAWEIRYNSPALSGRKSL
jgi:hypothetical protein